MRHRTRRHGADLSRRAVALTVGLAVALPALGTVTATPAAAAPVTAAAPDDGTLSVLLFYKDNFHASHVQARTAVKELAQDLATQYGETLEVQETQDPAVFNTANLSTKDVLVFAQTGGVLFNADQRTALESYIRGGGGYVGLHYAGWSAGTVSEHDVNPFYYRLVGALSEGHPENPAVRPGRVVNTDPTHPLTQGLPADFTRSDEWYDWTVNPAPNVRTLLEADEASYGGGQAGTQHPITWCQTIDSGRSWYTGMGHEGSAYSEPTMRQMIKNGIAYSSGLLAADCSPPSKDTAGSWSPVTPWPLMPINASLTADGTVQSFGSVSSGCVDNSPYDFGGNDCVYQGGQMEYDVWDPAVPRTLANVNDGLNQNTTYTDLFCAMQVQDPHQRATLTVGGDDGMGGNAPNDAAIGVTSYTKGRGLQNEAPMNYARWYPTGTTMPNGDILVQGGSLRGGPGGPGVVTPELRTGDTGSGWKLLTGARSTAAWGDGGSDHAGADENRWWYPRAFVAPGSGKVYNISGTATFEVDPYANGGLGSTTMLPNLPANIANQGADGNPVGATSTAVMYAPGKILQVGGGWWANGGGPAGARAGFTVDITGGTANPVVTATAPMKYQRHWPTATVLPNGEVLVTGGSRENNGNGGYVTNAEIWNPTTGQWREIKTPAAHARLYHSSALLLPDGRVMVGGGGAPGPRNYTDVEYYSPSYLFDGSAAAPRPTISQAPKKLGYDGTFQVAASGTVSRVTLLRNGSVTHGFNNDQNFQELSFTQSGGNLTIDAPQDATYAPPGAYMLFVWNADGTPSEGKIVEFDPTVKLDVRTPKVVDQFEYPRIPTEWRSNQAPGVIDVAPGSGRMSPWTVDSQVQLVRGTQPGQGGLGYTGYQLGLGAAGSMERELTGLDPGRDYRVAFKYARDSRTTGTAPGSMSITVGDLDREVVVTTTNPSASGGQPTPYLTFVDTFTASARSETLSLSGTGGAVMLDDLVVFAEDPGTSDVPVHYEFEESTGNRAVNSGTDQSVGDAVLTGTSAFSADGVFGGAVSMPGGSNANAVDLPDNLLQNASDFTTSFWAKPDTKGNWIGMFHIGDGLEGAGSFFQIQMQTQAAGSTGLAATFKKKNSDLQERIYATNPTRDVTAGQWNHVAFTRTGSTGTLFLNGQQVAQRTDLTLTMTDVGPTTNNWLGRNGFPDPAYDGLMDDVRIYTSSLTPADIAAMYADGTAKRTTTTVSVTPASPSPFEAPLTVSATVKDDTFGNASGTAALWVDGNSVGSTVEVAAGAVTFPALTLTPGDHTIEVRFAAAAGWRDSTATVEHTVERPPPGEGVPIRYPFDEGSGTTAANAGNDPSVGTADLLGSVGWTPEGKFGSSLSMPGGASTTNNHVRLPDNIENGMDDEFSVSIWARPDALPNWVPLLQIGSSTDTFFLLQSSTQAGPNGGPSGFAATFKAPGNPTQERLTLGAGNDLPLNQWTHVVFTMRGTTGRLYFDGELVATRDNFTIGIGDVGVGGNTTANFIGGTSWPDPRFDGLVDEFQMYAYELSESAVEELYAGPPVEPVDEAPVAVADAYSTDEDTVLEVAAPGVLANDTDAEDDALTATGLTQPEHGEVILSADGSFAYTPDEGWFGTDTFTYRANDGTSDSEPATVTITVVEVEDPPGPAEPAETALLASVPAQVVYGRATTVTVRAIPSAASGPVQVLAGTRVVATGKLTAGRASVTLPARVLTPGSYTLAVRYVGTAEFAPSSDSARLAIAKATSSITVTAPKTVNKGKRPVVKVTVSAPAGVAVAGRVTVKVKGKSYVAALKNGRVSFTLPKSVTKKVGAVKVSVTYGGSGLLTTAVRSTTIRVKR
ncbi:LamG-like jellyroll fold domain-containing protein [Nocardioides sp. C4-1]|uniref:LamG-like jellyroll fold domain-containing protein n=1 Tax=Nocardioides sp. C4-1 TaxID=3151851 RepID=UPI003263D453